MRSGKSTCLCRVLEILASMLLCQLSDWFSHCVVIYRIAIFVLLNTRELCLCIASPLLLARAGCSNMFSLIHGSLTLNWKHPVHSLTPIFHKKHFNIILTFISTYPKWSPLFDL